MSITIYQSVRRAPLAQKKIIELVTQLMKQLGLVGDVSIHLIGDTRMKRLNTAYRGSTKTTDVLAFATGGGLVDDVPDIGDVFVSIPQIQRQSRANHVPVREEFIRMLTHGVLHLAGYDHETPAEADEMFALQESFVKQYI